MWSDATLAAVEKASGRVVIQRTVSEEVTVYNGIFVLANVPVAALTSVADISGTPTWDVSALHFTTSTGAVQALSGPTLRGRLTVTYTAGPTSPAANHKAAGLIILQHLWQTRRGAGAIARGGEDEVYVPALGYAVPRRAVELLGLSLPGVA